MICWIYFNSKENKLGVCCKEVGKLTVIWSRKTTSLLRSWALKIAGRSLVSAILGCSQSRLKLKITIFPYTRKENEISKLTTEN